ncbi:MAG: hypothetical protein JW747_00255 [Candidatus Aminicenantes bacterium]|nr:hypothetical protein [Candidatus Aminicenantes bacterium]
MATAKKYKDSFFWGLILVTVGGLLLLENFDIDVLRPLARLWPLVLIAWGAWKLFVGLTAKKARRPKPPVPGE